MTLREAVESYRQVQGVDWEQAEQAAYHLYEAAQTTLKCLEGLAERIKAKDEYLAENLRDDGDWDVDVAECLADWDTDIADDAREVVRAEGIYVFQEDE